LDSGSHKTLIKCSALPRGTKSKKLSTTKTLININYETGFIEWYECILPLRDPFTVDKESYQDMEDAMHIQTKDELLGDDWSDNDTTEILDAK